MLIPLWLWPYITLGSSLLTFWLGNRYALNRDKRIEWNELTIVRRQDLRRIVGSQGSEFDRIADYLPFYQRWCFGKAWKRYEDACREAYGPFDPVTGDSQASPESKARYIASAKRLLRYLGSR